MVKDLEKLFGDCPTIKQSDIVCNSDGTPVFSNSKCASDEDAYALDSAFAPGCF